LKLRTLSPLTQERIAIGGVGRSGTTFLVQLFTALKFDTGYSLAEAFRDVDSISSAGLERPLMAMDNPYVIKSPWFHQQLDGGLSTGSVKLSWMIIPMRNLRDAAESRRRVYREAERAGFDPLVYPGSVWLTRELGEQEAVLAQVFFELVRVLARHRVPMLFLEFPRLVADPDHCYEALAPLLEEHGVDRREFAWAHSSVAKPDLVHDLRTPDTPEPAAIAKKSEPAVTQRRNDPCPCGSGKKFKHCHGQF
jgi:hypothetical protein